MLALIASHQQDEKVELREVTEPEPAPNEALVEVRAFSLNRGELRRLAAAQDGWRPGFDLAGVVVRPAADGSGPRAGARVVGLVKGGSWAQRVAVSTPTLAEIGESLGFADAATLPVSGLTALRVLRHGGMLAGQRVLITGAAGGLGRFAVQLAAMNGAHVAAVVGRPERGRGLRELGASEIVLEITPDTPRFDLVLESVGGSSLAAALWCVERSGTIVCVGSSSGEPTTLDAGSFYSRHGARLLAFALFADLERWPSATQDLSYLVSLLAAGKLDPQICLEESWSRPGSAMAALLERRLPGKAVLFVDSPAAR
jgi:NADPH:quinone reductase